LVRRAASIFEQVAEVCKEDELGLRLWRCHDARRASSAASISAAFERWSYFSST